MTSHKFVDLTNKKFERLFVIKKIGINKNKNIMWLCKCDCGKEIITSSHSLKSGQTKSCGCLRKDNIKKIATKHGFYNKKLYHIWNSMKDRCYNKNCKSYNWYGKQKIRVCDDWKNDFIKFKDWALNNGYKDDLTLDRINVNGDYCPENCRWITQKEQNRNKKTNIYYFLNGVKLCVADIMDIVGLKRNIYYDRKREGKKEIKDLFKGVDFEKYKIEEEK